MQTREVAVVAEWAEAAVLTISVAEELLMLPL